MVFISSNKTTKQYCIFMVKISFKKIILENSSMIKLKVKNSI